MRERSEELSTWHKPECRWGMTNPILKKSSRLPENLARLLDIKLGFSVVLLHPLCAERPP